MCEEETPTGQRFSLLYLPSDETLSDCPRMRHRLARLVDDCLSGSHTNYDAGAGRYLEGELGLSIVRMGTMNAYVNWEDFFRTAEIADLLDAITLILRYGLAERLDYKFRTYTGDVQRIFRERNMRYRIDEQGGIHPHVDSGFEQARVSAISGMEGERFNAARAHLDNVESSMISASPDNRQAIRSVFDAAENIFKMMFDGATHINKSEINNRLRPLLEEAYADRDTVKRAMLKQCESFKSWVEAAHFYRHADSQTEPDQPPDELTVLMVSQGYGWVRWLAELDRAMLAV